MIQGRRETKNGGMVYQSTILRNKALMEATWLRIMRGNCRSKEPQSEGYLTIMTILKDSERISSLHMKRCLVVRRRVKSWDFVAK